MYWFYVFIYCNMISSQQLLEICPGTYELLATQSGSCSKGSRATSPYAVPGVWRRYVESWSQNPKHVVFVAFPRSTDWDPTKARCLGIVPSTFTLQTSFLQRKPNSHRPHPLIHFLSNLGKIQQKYRAKNGRKKHLAFQHNVFSGPFTDLFGFIYETPVGESQQCLLTSCSESQVASRCCCFTSF